jgi:hypothetical protein
MFQTFVLCNLSLYNINLLYRKWSSMRSHNIAYIFIYLYFIIYIYLCMHIIGILATLPVVQIKFYGVKW